MRKLISWIKRVVFRQLMTKEEIYDNVFLNSAVNVCDKKNSKCVLFYTDDSSARLKGMYVVFSNKDKPITSPKEFSKYSPHDIKAIVVGNKVIVTFVECALSWGGVYAILNLDNNTIERSAVFSDSHTQNIRTSVTADGNVMIVYEDTRPTEYRDADTKHHNHYHIIINTDGKILRYPTPHYVNNKS